IIFREYLIFATGYYLIIFHQYGSKGLISFFHSFLSFFDSNPHEFFIFSGQSHFIYLHSILISTSACSARDDRVLILQASAEAAVICYAIHYGFLVFIL